MNTDAWSSAPRVVTALIERLARKASSLEGPPDQEEAFLKPDLYPVSNVLQRVVHSAQRSIDVNIDLRALATVYAHKVHQPAPNFSAIALAQSVSPAGLRRRYSERAEEAVRSLISSEPDIDLLRVAFATIEYVDLWGLSPAIDAELQKRSLRPPRVRGGSAEVALAVPFYADVQLEFQEQSPPPEFEAQDAIRTADRLPATLLGLVFAAFRNELATAEWIDSWITSPEQASLEWKGGLQIDQFLTLVLPVYSGSQHQRGVAGLRIKNHGSQSTVLTWYSSEEIDLRILRQPRSLAQ